MKATSLWSDASSSSSSQGELNRSADRRDGGSVELGRGVLEATVGVGLGLKDCQLWLGVVRGCGRCGGGYGDGCGGSSGGLERWRGREKREREEDLVLVFGGDGVSIHSATGSAVQPDILCERVTLAKSASGDGPRAHGVRRNRNATEPAFRSSFEGRHGMARHGTP